MIRFLMHPALIVYWKEDHGTCYFTRQNLLIAILRTETSYFNCRRLTGSGSKMSSGCRVECGGRMQFLFPAGRPGRILKSGSSHALHLCYWCRQCLFQPCLTS